jgi:hypothetical protein
MMNRIQAALHAPDGLKRLRDFILAKLLFVLPRGLRQRLFAGDQAFCPVCGSRLKRFLIMHRPYHRWCPVCRSLQRHRLIWLLFEQEHLLDHPSGASFKILHLAPEPCLEEKFRQVPGVDYLSADLYNPRAMVRADIIALQFAEQAFDLVFCSHVLEHVADDRKAMSELYRVTKPGGKAVVLVPVKGQTTDEDLTVTDPSEREHRFGQLDHVRYYGMDICRRLEQVGFIVRVLDQASLVLLPGDLEKAGLDPQDILFLCSRE